MQAKFVYEAMSDVLKGKSEEDIISSIEKKDLNPNDLLTQSAEKGFLYGVKKALEMGANIHDMNDLSLRYASMFGYYDVVKLLLKHGADVHAQVDDALRTASREGRYDVVELLLKHGADVHVANNRSLLLASERNQYDVVELLKKWMKKNFNESIKDILRPKSQEEIDSSFLERYGFIPNEETLVLATDRGKLKLGDHPFLIEYHRGPYGRYWKKRPGQHILTTFGMDELTWLERVISGEIEFSSRWTKGKNFK